MSYKHIIGKFKDETKLLAAVKKLKAERVNMLDIYGPFANHDLLKKFTRESRLPFAAVAFGIMAIILTFSGIYYTSVIDYPLSYGGKPIFSFPPMVVLMFLVTILLTTILLTFTFHGRSMIFPGKPAKTLAPDVTDDSFYLVLDQNYNPEEIKNWLSEYGADEIMEKELD